MAHNLPYYGYYKYGVIPWLDHGIQSYRHPEFISGYIIKMLKQVQHDFLFWIPWLDHGMTPNALQKLKPYNNAYDSSQR